MNRLRASHPMSCDLCPDTLQIVASVHRRCLGARGWTNPDADAGTPSITRLEGSRWRGGRLWSWNRDRRAWGGVDRGAVGARAAATRSPDVERTGLAGDATDSDTRSRHTTANTWVTTLAKTPGRTSLGAHEVSKPRVTVARWRAERIGPITIGAPHRGQCQASVSEDASTRGEPRRSNRRASARRGVRHALAR